MSVPVSEKGYTSGQTGRGWWQPTDDIEETPELRWPLSVQVYDRMRRQDPQVISVLRAVMLPIRRTAWRIDPAGASPDVTRFVADDLGLHVQGEAQPTRPLRTRDRFSWQDHLRLALTMLVFGHSFFEQLYRPVDGQHHLHKLLWLPPRTIDRVDVARDGGLIGIHQAEMRPKELIEVARLVAYVNEREGGNWLGQSLLRPAYKPWLLKDPALRTQSQTLDRNGMGIPDYETGPQPEGIELEERKRREAAEIAAGAGIVRNLRAGDNAGVSRPNGSKLTLRGVEGALPDADKQIRYHDEQIARAVLANFLNLGGDNSTGSYALGETFANFFVQSLQTVAMAIADVTTQHVIEDLVDINFGETVQAPRLVFDEIGSRHVADAKSIQLLIDAGVLTADDPLEQHIRTTHGLPIADPTTARERPARIPPTTGEAQS